MPQPTPSTQTPDSRRAFLRTSFALGTGFSGLAMSGCGKEESQPKAVTATPRRDIPLRVTLVSRSEDAEAIKRNWNSVAVVKLAINHIDPSSMPLDQVAQRTLESANSTDVMVVPVIMMADLFAEDSITELTDAWTQSTQAFLGPLWSALRNGAATYAARRYAVPLGCPLPALMTEGEAPELADWTAYANFVVEQDGKAAEPLAAGCCAESFLRRVSGDVDRNWLFDRDTFDPLITNAVYVEALSLMLKTASKYESIDLRPEEIGKKMSTGELAVGIGVPDGDASTSLPIDVRSPPRGLLAGSIDPGESRMRSIGPLLIPATTRVGVLPSACRQTASAKQFLSWLAGGEGITSVWNSATDFGRTRTAPSDATSPPDTVTPYESWRRDQLSQTIVRPTTQLIRGSEYLQVLDDAIRDGLTSNGKPQRCLSDVADAWRKLTDEVGVEKQKRAWRRTMGRSV